MLGAVLVVRHRQLVTPCDVSAGAGRSWAEVVAFLQGGARRARGYTLRGVSFVQSSGDGPIACIYWLSFLARLQTYRCLLSHSQMKISSRPFGFCVIRYKHLVSPMQYRRLVADEDHSNLCAFTCHQMYLFGCFPLWLGLA